MSQTALLSTSAPSDPAFIPRKKSVAMLMFHFITLTSDYHYVMRIPKNARSISISESERTPSYFALRTASDVYLLNGNWKISWPGRSVIAGCMFDYRRPFNGPEIITSDGPTNQDLVLEVSQSSSPQNITFREVTSASHLFISNVSTEFDWCFRFWRW